DLPVELPYEVDFTPHGKPPLATNEKWLNVNCPKCGKPAKRDAETLDTFFDSSWYFLRYVNPKYNNGPFDTRRVAKLTPVDVYFGGAEHTLGHTLYARFFTKFFNDQKMLDYDEFALKRVQHGVVLGPDGNKMSKSKGNVVNPDIQVKEYGSDTVRLYLCFMMPYEGTGPWSDQTIAGVNRFLTRIWEIYQNYFVILRQAQDDKSVMVSSTNHDKNLETKLKKTIKKVTEDISNIKMNTAIAAMMEFLNDWERNPQGLLIESAKNFLQILAPFAPFLTEEIWRSIFGEKTSIHLSSWPKVEGEIFEEKMTIPVQVNGRLRSTIWMSSEKITNKKYVEEMALKEEKVKKYLTGKDYKIVYVPGKILNFVIN
ncbi:leucine--tRNA ligase, partial [Candidatus Roizmanbacteria bacterium CG11_big_fil_rev_8_21_14_0_20_35_14]